MTKTRPFLSMCYGDPSATEVPPCCETATKKLTFSTTSVLLLLNMPLSLSRATIFRRQKNPRRVYRPKIAGILFVCNEPEGKYYTVPCFVHGLYSPALGWTVRKHFTVMRRWGYAHAHSHAARLQQTAALERQPDKMGLEVAESLPAGSGEDWLCSTVGEPLTDCTQGWAVQKQ